MGKSTTTSALVRACRARGQRVGVLAVDPSSPFSGGALLGDRVRMQEHATDPGVFIRSMASRGHLGGLAWATPQALRVLDAAGCDVVLVETVGRRAVARSRWPGTADTTLVLLAPGMGDGIQAAKAGILEIGDVFVVNKADRDGADATARELRHMLTLGDRRDRGWSPAGLKTVASRGEGIDRRAWRPSTGTPAWLARGRPAARAAAASGGRRDRGDRPGRPARADRGPARRRPPRRAGRARGRPASSTPTPPPTSCSAGLVG